MIAFRQFLSGNKRIGRVADVVLPKKQIHAPARSLHDGKDARSGCVGPVIQRCLRAVWTAANHSCVIDSQFGRRGSSDVADLPSGARRAVVTILSLALRSFLSGE